MNAITAQSYRSTVLHALACGWLSKKPSQPRPARSSPDRRAVMRVSMRKLRDRRKFKEALDLIEELEME